MRMSGLRVNAHSILDDALSRSATTKLLNSAQLTRIKRRRMNPLFNKVDVFAVIEHQKQGLKDAFQSITNTELDTDPVAVAAKLIEQFGVNVPVLEEDKKYAVTKETQVDVSRDPTRFIRDRSQPFYVGGTEVKIVIPFRGDAPLFDVRPTMFTLNPPFGEIHGNELHLVYVLARPDFDVEAAANRTVGQVNQYLQSLQGSAEQLKGELQQLVNSSIQKRKQERGAHSQIIAGLKIPVRQAPTTETPVTEPARSNTPDKNDEWDVFISHASEDKNEIARPLAEALRAKGLRVWYDDFSLQLGDSLRQSIDRGLGRSRFGVVILSPRFFEKHWPQQELNGLVTREVNATKVILPVWHGVTFDDVRRYSVTLADRLAVQTSQGLAVVVEKIMAVVLGNGAQTPTGKTVDNSFDGERVRHVRQVVLYAMTFSGQQLLRWLLLQGQVECVRQFVPEISIETQNHEIEIAVNAGIVRRVEERGALSHTYYVVNPELKAALESVLAEILAEGK
jgi:hypothetical protein